MVNMLLIHLRTSKSVLKFKGYRFLFILLSTGDAVVNVYINQEKRFAFVEMRTVEEASNAMALDGIVYEVVIPECFLAQF